MKTNTFSTYEKMFRTNILIGMENMWKNVQDIN